jgi:hypothetical protein
MKDGRKEEPIRRMEGRKDYMKDGRKEELYEERKGGRTI